MEPVKNNNREFMALISRLVKKIYSIDRNEKFCLGVTVSQCYIIETLSIKGPLSMNELSREMELAISTMTRILDVLVRDKIVLRLKDPNDRRKVLVRLSEKGEGLHKKLRQCTYDYTKTILDNIPDDQKKNIIKSLEILFEAVNNLGGTCCPGENKKYKK